MPATTQSWLATAAIAIADMLLHPPHALFAPVCESRHNTSPTPSPLKSPTPTTCQRVATVVTGWVIDPLADFQMTFCPVWPLRHSTSASPAKTVAGRHAKAMAREEIVGTNVRMAEPPQGGSARTLRVGYARGSHAGVKDARRGLRRGRRPGPRARRRTVSGTAARGRCVRCGLRSIDAWRFPLYAPSPGAQADETPMQAGVMLIASQAVLRVTRAACYRLESRRIPRFLHKTGVPARALNPTWPLT